MRKLLFASITIYYVLIIPIVAQDNDIFNIIGTETEDFPTVKSFFIAKKFPGGQNFYNAPLNIDSPEGFDVKENGKNINDKVKLVCDELEISMPVHVALTMDASISMFENYLDGRLLSDIAIRAGREFIDSMDFSNGSSISVIPFGGREFDLRWLKGWQFDKETAKKTLEDNYNRVGGATDFNNAFYFNNVWSAVSQLKTKPAGERRVILFFTDGVHEDSRPFEFDLIAEIARENNIEVYIVVFASTMVQQGLDYISSATGGMFRRANNEEELRNFYRLITDRFKSTSLCWLEWYTDYICQLDETKDIEITFKESKVDIKRSFSYSINNEDALSEISIDNSKLYFDENGTNSHTVTLTSIRGDYTISDYFISENDSDFEIPEFNNMPTNGFLIEEGKSLEFTINYLKSGESLGKTFDLEFISETCPVENIKLIAPCNGEYLDNIDLKLIQFGTESERTLTNVFVNTSSETITGNIFLQGTDASDVEILSINAIAGNQYELDPGESMSILISINPSKTGIIEFSINYGLISDCGIATTLVTADSEELALNLDNLVFELQRILTEKSKNYTIVNTSQQSINIESIELSDENSFTINNPNALIGELLPGESKYAEINFNPKNEGLISTEILVKISLQNDPITAEVSGIGYLPDLTWSNIEFGNSNIIDGPINGIITLNNNSNYGDLELINIKIKDNTDNFNELNLDLSSFTPGNIIEKNGIFEIPFTINPTQIGLKEFIVIVDADNTSGPEPIEFQENEILISVNIIGSGIVIFNDINFSNTPVCGIETLQSDVIVNNSNEELRIDISIDQHADLFTFNTPFIIPPNSSASIPINFEPNTVGSFNAELTLIFNDGRSGQILINGNSIREERILQVIYPEESELYEVDLGQKLGLNLEVDLSGFRYNPTNIELSLRIVFNPYVLNPVIDNLDFLEAEGSWTWDRDMTLASSGIVTLNIDGSTNIIDSKLEFTLNFDTFLGNSVSDLIRIEVLDFNFSCFDLIGTDANVELIACVLENTLLDPESIFPEGTIFLKYDGEHPVRNYLDLEYTVSYKSNVSISLYDIAGNMVTKLFTNELERGTYNSSFNLNYLNNGVYFIEYESGYIKKHLKMMKIR